MIAEYKSTDEKRAYQNTRSLLKKREDQNPRKASKRELFRIKEKE